jgi:hypothetical protein
MTDDALLSPHQTAIHRFEHWTTIQRSGREAFLPGWENILSSPISAQRRPLRNADFFTIL